MEVPQEVAAAPEEEVAAAPVEEAPEEEVAAEAPLEEKEIDSQLFDFIIGKKLGMLVSFLKMVQVFHVQLLRLDHVRLLRLKPQIRMATQLFK